MAVKLNKKFYDDIKEHSNELFSVDSIYPSNHTSASTYNVDKFKEFVTSNSCPNGVSFWALNISGVVSFVMVGKANNRHLSFFVIGSGFIARQYRLNNGSWYEHSFV